MFAGSLTHRFQRYWGKDFTVELNARRFDDPTLDQAKRDQFLKGYDQGLFKGNEVRAEFGLEPDPALEAFKQPPQPQPMNVMLHQGQGGPPGAGPGAPGAAPTAPPDSDFDLSPELPDDDGTGVRMPFRRPQPPSRLRSIAKAHGLNGMVRTADVALAVKEWAEEGVREVARPAPQESSALLAAARDIASALRSQSAPAGQRDHAPGHRGDPGGGRPRGAALRPAVRRDRGADADPQRVPRPGRSQPQRLPRPRRGRGRPRDHLRPDHSAGRGRGPGGPGVAGPGRRHARLGRPAAGADHPQADVPGAEARPGERHRGPAAPPARTAYVDNGDGTQTTITIPGDPE
jgi:hypothetical protein